MAAVILLATDLGVRIACRVFGFPRATLYRLRGVAARPPGSTKRQRLRLSAISAGERLIILAHLRSDRFVDCSPVTVYYTLLDEGIRLCSIRTMYRISEENGDNAERRHLRKKGKAKKPELLAIRPNQLWSWDITYLKGPKRGVWLFLYVIIDVFSRRVVGWTLARQESGELAKELIKDACLKEGIEAGKLTLHADRGAPMKSKSVVGLLGWLGVEPSYSRPSISNDNPFSESHFKTLKYCPAFPDRFGSFEDAMGFLRLFFLHYNTQHFHSGICYLHPDTVHYGQPELILEQRYQVELAFYELHPERFPRGAPRRKVLPKAVWINPPRDTETTNSTCP